MPEQLYGRRLNENCLQAVLLTRNMEFLLLGLNLLDDKQQHCLVFYNEEFAVLLKGPISFHT
jgi:hypothetical protein